MVGTVYEIHTLSKQGDKMNLLNLDVSVWGISLSTYFGDVFLFWRTIYLALGIVAILLVAKRIRKRNNQVKESALVSDPSIWED